MLDKQTRAALRAPVATVDIGSNSVRLVVYEKLSRSPIPIFNEKVLCGLGRNVASTGRLADDAIEKALRALARFRVLCEAMNVSETFVLATAAAREASNGPDFLARAEEACGQPISLISGQREAELSAYGVIAGFHEPDGVVGDLGGGSLELVDVKGLQVGQGLSLPLGGLALQDRAGGSIAKAERIVRQTLAKIGPLEHLKGRTFYAVGGTWRALAKLHMGQKGYPMHVMHAYAMPPRDVVDYAQIVERVDPAYLESIESVPEARRALLAYGALVLEEIIKRGKPKEVMISALGVREGLLYEQLDAQEKAVDPLLAAATELNRLRSRSPEYAQELIDWTDDLVGSLSLDETPQERRLRHAACLLSDVGWRAHPDYRAEQSLNVIAYGSFVGIDHPGRAFLALSVYFRHMGVSVDGVHPRLRELVASRLLDRARILGGAMRAAYLISASMPGILPRTPMRLSGGKLILTLPRELELLASDRLMNRIKQLARLIGLKSGVDILP